MNETEIRNRLQDLADEAPRGGLLPPPHLVRRAWRRVVLTLASTLIIVLAALAGGILGLEALRSADRTRPADQTTEQPSKGLFESGHGWLVYRSGSEFMAVDPATGKEAVSLGPSHGLDPVAASRDGSRLLLGFSGRTEDLYMLNPNGSRIQLTTDGMSYSGSISPDGALVAYTKVSGRFLPDDGLYVIDSTGDARELLVAVRGQTALTDPVWSPDGSRIAFIELEIVGETSWGEPVYGRTLSVVNADGTGRQVLIDLGREDRSPTGWASDLAWSPDGSQFAFSSSSLERPGNYQIYVVNVDGSELRQLTSEGDSSQPVWSPDGLRIAFACGSALCTMGADGTDVREITGAAPAGSERFVWTSSLDPFD